VIEQNDWSATQRQKLRSFAQQLDGLAGLQLDMDHQPPEKGFAVPCFHDDS
jgi:hypothetical protein